jgi:hypothetical protein
MADPLAGIQRRWLHWALLSFLFVVEFVIFDRETSRHYAWVVPRWNDQIQYLTEVYRGYDTAHSHGLGAGLMATAKKPSAQGLALEVAGVAMLDLAGPSRSAALALNMLGWIAVQAAFFAVVWRRFRRPSLAWLSVGVCLLWVTPLRDLPGSAWDFRLDFCAACGFGVCLALAIATDGFGRWLPSLLFGALVGLTLLERFITGTYFVLIYAGMGLWLLCLPRRLPRLAAFVASGVVAALIAGPIFWLNQSAIADYYYWGHYFGPESAIRDPKMGVVASVRWLLTELFGGHLKGWFWVGMGLLAAGTVWSRRDRDRIAPPDRARGGWWVPTLLFFLGPFVVLTLHELKSYVVLSVLVPPIFASCIGAAAAFWPAPGGEARARWVAGAVFLVGFGQFVGRQLSPLYSPEYGRQARVLNSLIVEIAHLSDQAHLQTPRVGVDQITDCLDGQIMNVVLFERERRWRSLLMTLPTGIDSTPEHEVMDRLERSDFVFLHLDGVSGIYPFDRQMTERFAEHAAWCDAHLVKLQEYDFFGRRWAFYARPEIAKFRQ